MSLLLRSLLLVSWFERLKIFYVHKYAVIRYCSKFPLCGFFLGGLAVSSTHLIKTQIIWFRKHIMLLLVFLTFCSSSELYWTICVVSFQSFTEYFPLWISLEHIVQGVIGMFKCWKFYWLLLIVPSSRIWRCCLENPT